MKKIVLASALLLFGVLLSSFASADWFGSSASRGLTGLAVIAGSDEGTAVDASADAAAEVTTAASAGKKALKEDIMAALTKSRKMREAARKAAMVKVKAVKAERRETVVGIAQDQNLTGQQKAEQIKGVMEKSKGDIDAIKQERKETVKAIKEERKKTVKYTVEEAKKIAKATIAASTEARKKKAAANEKERAMKRAKAIANARATVKVTTNDGVTAASADANAQAASS